MNLQGSSMKIKPRFDRSKQLYSRKTLNMALIVVGEWGFGDSFGHPLLNGGGNGDSFGHPLLNGGGLMF